MQYPGSFEMVAFYNVFSFDATGNINHKNQHGVSIQSKTIAL
jgi:hypothetical protein